MSVKKTEAITTISKLINANKELVRSDIIAQFILYYLEGECFLPNRPIFVNGELKNSHTWKPEDEE